MEAMMPEGYVQLPNGTKIRTYSHVTGTGDTVHDQLILLGGLPTFYIQTPVRANTTTAVTFLDIFNAVGSPFSVSIKKIFIQVHYAAVTGAVNVFSVNRTTSAGTGGTVLTPRPANSEDPAMPAQVTVRHGATGGAAQAFTWLSVPLTAEETSTTSGMSWATNILAEGNETRDLRLNPGEGMSVTLPAQTASSGSYSILAVICLV